LPAYCRSPKKKELGLNEPLDSWLYLITHIHGEFMKKLALALIAVFAFSTVVFAEEAKTEATHEQTTEQAAPAGDHQAASGEQHETHAKKETHSKDSHGKKTKKTTKKHETKAE
jgi:hypothetical protein